MPWHDDTPWAAKRRRAEQDKAVTTRRLEQIESLVERAKCGQVSHAKALDEIEEIARGGADAIVRVGGPHVPDIQATEER